MADNVEKYEHVFTYGTLKRNQPFHHHMNDKSHGYLQFIGNAQTVEKLPLICASEFNIPFVIDRPGMGVEISGEVYRVDDRMMRRLDEIECYPEVYDRRLVTVRLTQTFSGQQGRSHTGQSSGDNAHTEETTSDINTNPHTDKTITNISTDQHCEETITKIDTNPQTEPSIVEMECWIYVLKKYPDVVLVKGQLIGCYDCKDYPLKAGPEEEEAWLNDQINSDTVYDWLLKYYSQ